jgi:DNA-binding NarL/FixJ family response regulator
MDIFFVTSPQIKSERWLVAFPDARVITSDRLSDAKLSADSMVWVLLDGQRPETIKYCLASGSKVIAMTLKEDVKQAQTLLAAGARGYVHALAEPDLLVRIQQVVSSGGAWLGAALLKQLLVSIEKSVDKNKKPMEELTERENAVAACIAKGKSNKEVAKELNITERTVKAHLGACFNKLNVRDRMQLALAIKK